MARSDFARRGPDPFRGLSLNPPPVVWTSNGADAERYTSIMGSERDGLLGPMGPLTVLDNLDDSVLMRSWAERLSTSYVIVCADWDSVLEDAIEAAAGPDPLSDLLRILREHAPDVASAKALLPRSRAEALQMIAILISLMSIWIATHQGDRHLSPQDEIRLAHAMGAELRSAAEHQYAPHR